MTARLSVLTLVATVLLFSLPADAQTQSGRYTMKDIEDGILRLDTQTGEVSYCRKVEDNWACETAADDRSDLADEIVRLQEENAKLRDRLAELEKQPAVNKELNLPSDEDMEQVMSFMERLMRRFYAFTKSLRDQVEEDRKTGEDT